MLRFRLVPDLDVGTCAMGAVDLVVGSGEVVADLLGDELSALAGFAVAFDLEGAHVAFGDEAVAFRESGESPFGCGAVGDEVVERRLERGEGAAVFVAEVRLTDAHVEAGVAVLSDRLLRIGSDEARE